MPSKSASRLVQTQVRLPGDERADLQQQARREDVDVSVVHRRALRAGWRNLYGRPLGGVRHKKEAAP